jgi:hypothetical protein
MGWLDNSTNNIILDAVLTDYGRQALARNDGSFKIAKFALGDDEINYGIITKYGRTVGREKIEKNTPIFEAFTNQNLGLKYRMISTPRPLLYMPRLQLVSTSATSISLSTSDTGEVKSYSTIKIEQQPQGGETTVDADLMETNFDVYVPDLFLYVMDQSSIGSPDSNKIAKYTIRTSSGGSVPTLEFKIHTRSLTTTMFTTYGRLTTNATREINTSLKIVGRSSGAVGELPVSIISSLR